MFYQILCIVSIVLMRNAWQILNFSLFFKVRLQGTKQKKMQFSMSYLHFSKVVFAFVVAYKELHKLYPFSLHTGRRFTIPNLSFCQYFSTMMWEGRAILILTTNMYPAYLHCIEIM
jgi:hypothetical protein